MARPNVIFVFADQWRYSACGFGGEEVRTPNIDALRKESILFSSAVSNCPVCSPARASILTGRYPLTHGVFVNDVRLDPSSTSVAEVFRDHGYETAYIGKWHLDGSGSRRAFIPRNRRAGFEFWMGYECNHRYFEGYYYAEDGTLRRWEGYEPEAQTTAAIDYIRHRAQEGRPFLLFLSWGPPHDPYHEVPERLLQFYEQHPPTPPPNVPSHLRERAQQLLQGYYAHVTALDEQVGRLIEALYETGIEEDTIFILTSDHGDMLCSHGLMFKQWPHEESIRVPFLLRWPSRYGKTSRTFEEPFGMPDIAPTLLGLCGLEIPDTFEGRNVAPRLDGKEQPCDELAGVLLMNVWPFGNNPRRSGGREWRGIRTSRHTYARTLEGPWLLFDNEADPHQMCNLCNLPETEGIQSLLDERLQELLDAAGDEFLPGKEYIKTYGYRTMSERNDDPVVYEW